MSAINAGKELEDQGNWGQRWQKMYTGEVMGAVTLSD